jgi:hypothetical protein
LVLRVHGCTYELRHENMDGCTYEVRHEKCLTWGL